MSKYHPWKETERVIARKFRSLGFQAERNWADQFERKSGRDVTVKGKYNFCIQVKYGKQPRMEKAWIEANTAKEKGEIPLAVVRFKDKKSTLAVISFSDLMGLIGGEK